MALKAHVKLNLLLNQAREHRKRLKLALECAIANEEGNWDDLLDEPEWMQNSRELLTVIEDETSEEPPV